MGKVIVLLLSLVSILKGEDAAKDNMGGVSAEKKLKIVTTHEVPADKCELRSRLYDNIKWKYVGKLLNGTVFHEGDFKATIGRGHVIHGVDEGMRGMCVGEKRTITIHPDWAYGERGNPGVVPPNAVLIFDVEMTDIERPKEEL